MLKETKKSLLHLAFPRVSEACGTDNVQADHCLQQILIRMQTVLSRRSFGEEFLYLCNITILPYKRIFGAIAPASIQVQANKEVGTYQGKLMGWAMAKSNCFYISTL